MTASYVEETAGAGAKPRSRTRRQAFEVCAPWLLIIVMKRYVRATLKALAWTKNNMEAAVAEVIKVSPDRELKLETRKLAIIYDLYKSPDYSTHFGLMNDAKWQSSIDILADSGDLPKKPTLKEIYTNAIVESIDEAKTLAAAIKAPTN